MIGKKNDRYIEDHTTYIVAGLPPTPRYQGWKKSKVLEVDIKR